MENAPESIRGVLVVLQRFRLQLSSLNEQWLDVLNNNLNIRYSQPDAPDIIKYIKFEKNLLF